MLCSFDESLKVACDSAISTLGMSWLVSVIMRSEPASEPASEPSRELLRSGAHSSQLMVESLQSRIKCGGQRQE